MGKRYSRSSTVVRPARARSAARRGPTPFRNWSGVASRSSLSADNRLAAFYYVASAQSPPPVVLPRPHQQIELAPLHLLFENAPAGLRHWLEDFVEAVGRFADLDHGAGLGLAQRLQALGQPRGV